jgi:outer membrane biosynthesis protein TonB
MLADGDGLEHRSAAMEVRQFRQFIRPDIALSVIVHLSLVAFVVIYTEVRPFRSVVVDQVPVDIVVADEPAKKPPDLKPTPQPSPSPDFSMLASSDAKPDQSEGSSPSASPSPQGAHANPAAASAQPKPQQPAPPQQQQQAPQPQPQQPQPQQPQPQQPSQSQPQQPAMPSSATSAAPAYTTPQPDLTIKYHVMLGLPEDLSPTIASAGEKRGEGGDTGPAAENLASNLVDLLRHHLKACSKLPSGLSPSDNVAVKLRVQLNPDGRLAAEPALIEGSASTKGVELMRGAVAALAACQPYSELPAGRYGEWKVLDLSFTPRDFNS